MLIELWEKLRGYDKWVETEAKIMSSQAEAIPNRYGETVNCAYDSNDTLTWVDAAGETQSAQFEVDEQSPLYQLIGGESVTIRYDPRDPSRFYFRELLRSQVNFAVRTALTAGVALVIGYVILGMRIWLLIKRWNH